MRRLYIQNTELDNVSISKLSEILKQNKTIKILELWSCKLIDGFKQVGDILSSNTNLEQFVLWQVTGIIDEDTSDLTAKLASNMSLTHLWLSYCMSKIMVSKIFVKGLTENKTLTELNIGGNNKITSLLQIVPVQ